MTRYPMKRGARRFLVAERLGVRASATLEVRLVDLSATGARIEHDHPLTPGVACTFQFPPTLGSLVLTARVVHSMVFTSEKGEMGDGVARYQSGLFFVDVTADQQAALAAILKRLSPGCTLDDAQQRT